MGRLMWYYIVLSKGLVIVKDMCTDQQAFV